MRRVIALGLLVASGCAEPAPPLPPGPGEVRGSEAIAPSVPPAVPEYFRLTFTREEDGYWRFLRCELDVDVMEGPAPVTLACQTRDRMTMTIRSEVDAMETMSLRDLVEQANIYDPPHAGVARGLVHWRFETITLRPIGLDTSVVEHAVVVVASGNESFTRGARGKLLYTLWRLQDDLEERVQ